MKVNFYLMKPDKNKLCRIYLFFRYNANELRFSTNIKIISKHWNKKEHYIYSADNLAADRNERLRLIEKSITEIYTNFQSIGIIPNNETLTNKLNEILNKPIEKIKSFFDYFTDFLQLQLPPAKDKKTHDKIKTVYNHLKNFEKTANYLITFERLNDVFFNKFFEFCTNNLDLERSTIARYVKILNQFNLWAFEKEFYNLNRPIKFKVKECKQLVIFLNKDEFLKLYNANIENKRLSNIRDLFCFGCVTGIRFAAMQRLTINHIQDKFIFYNADKSNKQTLVPITDFSKSIIEKHKGNKYLLPQISNQKANIYLREVAEKLELNRIVTQLQFKGSKTNEAHYKLYEKLSFKISKKTCITLLSTLGVNPETIGIFTANNMETIKHYLGNDNTESVKKFLNAFDSISE